MEEATRAGHLRPGAAFAVAMGGIAAFSLMDALMKALVITMGTMPAVLWRAVAAVLLSGALFLARRRPWPERGSWRLHVGRGAIGAVLAVLYFWGLARVPLAEAVALAFVAPLAALVLAGLWLGETISRRAVLASLVAFAGVLVIVLGQAGAHGAGDEIVLGSLAVIAAALLYAVNIVMMRAQSQIAGPIEIAFYQNLVMAGGLWLTAPAVGLHLPTPAEVPGLIGAAALANVSLLLLAWAYGHAPASYLAPSEYTGFIWAVLLGWLMFGEGLAATTLAGTTLIVAGCLWGVRGSAAGPGMEP